MNDIDLKVKKLHIDENSEYRIRRGLPWIFDKYCHFDTTPDNGDVVAIYGKRNKCIAIGLYDAYSPIRVRILGSKCTFNQAYMYDKFRAAIEYLSKQGIASNDTTGVRLLSGESQGLPGIVIDAYAGTWVVKVYSAIWLNYIDSFLQMLIDVIGLDDDITRKAYVVPLRRIVLRFGRECRAIYEAAGYREGQLLGSNDDTPYADFMENGMHLRAQVFRGQKTGFFLDQRQNRQIVRSLSAGKKSLDICCYSGTRSNAMRCDLARSSHSYISHFSRMLSHDATALSSALMRKCSATRSRACLSPSRLQTDLAPPLAAASEKPPE